MSCYPFKKVVKIHHLKTEPGYQFSVARSCNCTAKHLQIKEVWKNNLNIKVKSKMIEYRHYTNRKFPLKIFHCVICDFKETCDF